MYEIDSWINSRSFVPEKKLNIIYREFNDFMHSDNYIPAYSNTCMLHHTYVTEKIEIPQKVKEMYSTIGRYTPIHRAKNLEKKLGTNCKIYLKREDFSPTGSFKLSSQIPQVYYAKQEGKKTILLGTSAGQTGASGALAAKLFDMNCRVFVANHAYKSRKGRCNLMRMYGAEVISSPSMETEIGRVLNETKEADFKSTEAIAVAEVTELISKNDSAVYCPGSFADFTLTYSSVIGLETIKQFEKMEILPDKIIGCIGGGSSFGGMVLPFLKKYGDQIKYIATESDNIPKMTKGQYRFDHPMTDPKYPKCKMYTLGYEYTPSDLHATGLRFHGLSPILSYLLSKNTFTPYSITQNDAIKAACLLAQTEGIIVAPESSYSMAQLIKEAKKNEGTVLLSCVTGNGYLDLNAYGEML